MKPRLHTLYNIFVFTSLLAALFGAQPITTASAESKHILSTGFKWAKSMGGTNGEAGARITIDSGGNAYTIGNFAGTIDADPSANVLTLVSNGDKDIFITKVDADGNLVWAKSIGGTGIEDGSGIAVDANDNVYMTGSFQQSVDFDPGLGVAYIGSTLNNAFILKLDTNGNYVWVADIGGAGSDAGLGITVDAGNNVYTTGYFEGVVDFDPSGSTYNMSVISGSMGIFISKLDSNGNFVWAKGMGGLSSINMGKAITTDAAGNVYIAGTFSGTVDFDPGINGFQMTSAGNTDIFISNLDSSGNFIWAKHMGGAGNDQAASIVVDVNNNVYTTGYFVATADFDPGASTFNMTSAGGFDSFVSKLDSNGVLVWVKQLGGTGDEFGNGISLDSLGRPYIIGRFHGTTDFDPGINTNNLISAGMDDIYVCALDKNGNFMWANSTGGTESDAGQDIAIRGGVGYITGYFSGTVDFDPSSGGTSYLTSAGGGDVFISQNITFASISINTVNGTKTFTSIGAQDGWVLESAEKSSKGGTKNNGASVINIGDNASKKQYRAILSFDTSATLPDKANITKVTLMVKKNGVSGKGNPMTLFKGLMLDIKNGTFGTAGLALSDFQAKQDVTVGPLKPVPSSGWYSIDLTSAKDYINNLTPTNGYTQIRLRFKLDDNNNSAANFLKLYSGNAANTADRPQLIVEYYYYGFDLP